MRVHMWTTVSVPHARTVLLLHFLSLTMAMDYSDYDVPREEQPYFLPRPTNVSFNKGDTPVLVCGIENLGTKTVIWRRASDPNPLTIGSDVYVGDARYSTRARPQDKEWHLVIEEVQLTDAGVYECQISSRAKLIHHILLRVNTTAKAVRKDYVNYKQDQQPPVHDTNSAIFVSGTKFVEKGDSINLFCNSTGLMDPPENLDWFKDGIKLTPDGVRQIKIEKFHVQATRTLVSVLQIKHSKMEDAGTYVCRSSDLSITSTKVHVLNAGSTNVRRGTSATDKAEGSGSKEGKAETVNREAVKGRNRGSCTAATNLSLFVCLLLVAITTQHVWPRTFR